MSVNEGKLKVQKVYKKYIKWKEAAEALQNISDTMRDTLDNKYDEIRDLTDRATDAERQLATMTDTKNQLETAMATAKNEATKRNTDFQNIIDTMQKTLADKEKEIQAITERTNDTETQLATMATAKNEATKRNTDFHNIIDTMQGTLDAKDEEIHDLTDRATDAERQLATMADTKKQLEATMATKEQTCEATTKALKDELDVKSGAERECNQENAKFRQLVSEQNKTLKALDALELSDDESDESDELYNTSTLKF